MQVEVKELPKQKIAAVGHLGDYSKLCNAFQKIEEWTQQTFPDNRSITRMGIYYDDPKSTPPELCRSEAAIVVGDKEVPEEEGIILKEFPGGKYACVPCEAKGAENFQKAWMDALGAVAQANHEFDDRPYLEIYKDMNVEEDGTHHFKFDICAAIK